VLNITISFAFSISRYKACIMIARVIWKVNLDAY